MISILKPYFRLPWWWHQPMFPQRDYSLFHNIIHVPMVYMVRGHSPHRLV